MASVPLFDEFDVADLIHQGPTADVFRGRRKSDGSPVLLRVLFRDEAPASAARLAREYALTRDLHLPGVAEPVAAISRRDRHVLVLADSGVIPLAAMLSVGRAIDSVLALRITESAAAAVGQIHDRGITHRGLSPSHILVADEGRHVVLTGFGSASRLAAERGTLSGSDLAPAVLAYASPEQTGRMNRVLDYRTDFYSLGVCLYEMLTGQLPFRGSDPLELIHAHVARRPAPPSQLNPAVPASVCAIVDKLLAKTPEERYQSARGLGKDLQACREALQVGRSLDGFEPGSRDSSDRFRIPERLYGRERELATLMRSFHRVVDGATEIVLVAGYSGIGKSALVGDLSLSIAQHRGDFASGKFDQYRQAVPYDAIVQAFQGLVRYRLGAAPEHLERWRSRLLTALGPNSGVITSVIPEVEHIIGPQPPVPRLPPSEARNRFEDTFRVFVRALARAEHPMVVFLDDLQWADAASLQLFEVLATDPRNRHLLIIGAYRVNEVGQDHPLLRSVAAVRESGAPLHTITLDPLGLPHITELVADALDWSPARSELVAELLQRKTTGNPFFVKELMTHLHGDGSISFDAASRTWVADLERIRAAGVTDDVVDLMISKIRTLGQTAQQALQIAACVGNRFSLDVLATASEQPEAATSAALWEALAGGLIVRTGRDPTGSSDRDGADSEAVEYTFLHDRVQQAAYALLAAEERAPTHLRIGRLLAAEQPDLEASDDLFEIVNHFILGQSLIEVVGERLDVARLLLLAGRRATDATAHEAALRYFRAGLILLPDDTWEAAYELTLALHVAGVEAEYVNLNFEAAKDLSEPVFAHARTELDRAVIHEVEVRFYIAQNRMREATDTALRAVGRLGVDVVRQELPRLVGQLPQLDALGEMPCMDDPRHLAALRILALTSSSTYQSEPALLPHVALAMANLCQEHGLSPLAAYGYGIYGLVLCGPLGEIETGYYAGRLAQRTLAEHPARELECKIGFLFNAFIRHWKEPHRLSVQGLREASPAGVATGDFTFAAYARTLAAGYALLTSAPLRPLAGVLDSDLAAAGRMKQEHSWYSAKVWRQLVACLCGEAEHAHLMRGSHYGDKDNQDVVAVRNDTVLFFVRFSEMLLSYIMGDLDAAVTHSAEAARVAVAVPASMLWSTRVFYDALVRLAVLNELDDDEREASLDQVARNLEMMDAWERLAAVNWQSKRALVEAERARALGDHLAAVGGYERAITLAEAQGFVTEVAIASERAAEVHRDLGHTTSVRFFVENARDAYACWGASAKVEQLEAAFEADLAPARHHSSADATRSEPDAAAHDLDLRTVVKASQALSGELVLAKLVRRLVELALENAGATRGVLVLDRGPGLSIEAGALANGEAFDESILGPLTGSDLVPEAIVRYVHRTGESLVLGEATTVETFQLDPYVVRHRPRSVLCMPVARRGRLNGALYLENDLVDEAFTERRLTTLGVILSQAAISLDNAALFEERARAEGALRESESRFRRLAENARDMIYCMTLPDGIYEYVSPAAVEITGYTAEEIMATPMYIRDAIHPDWVDYFHEQWEKLLAGEMPRTYNYQLVDKAGRTRWISQRNALVRDASGIPVAIEGIVSDVTEERTMEERLRQSEKMEAIGQLAGGVAHDFNNLLMVIGGNAELLRRTLPESAEEAQFATHIKVAVDRAADLTAQLLAFARKGKKQTLPVNVHEIVAEVKTLLLRTVDRRIRIATRLEATNTMVSGDPSQLQNAILNLAVNARDAMPEGGLLTFATSDVTIDEAPDDAALDQLPAGRYVRIEVTDTGIGMDDRTRSRVFEPFFTTKGVGEGTGLGLASVYGCVKDHLGSIDVRSEEGQGSSFRVLLPIVDAPEETADAAPPTAAVRGTGHVLVVDDDESVRNVAVRILRRSGYTVETTADGAQAVDYVRAHKGRIDLVILDLIMPELSGADAYYAMRSIDPSLKVLVASGFAQGEAIERLLNEGVVAILRKPFALAELENMVATHIRSPSAEALSSPGKKASPRSRREGE